MLRTFPRYPYQQQITFFSCKTFSLWIPSSFFAENLCSRSPFHPIYLVEIIILIISYPKEYFDSDIQLGLLLSSAGSFRPSLGSCRHLARLSPSTLCDHWWSFSYSSSWNVLFPPWAGGGVR